MSSPLLLAAALLAGPAVAEAEAPRRFALVVGNNVGDGGDPVLQFAERDAVRVAQAFSELGSVGRDDLVLLLGEGEDAVLDALARLETRMAGAPAMLLFYYSGHADDRELHLGGTRLSWDALRDRLRRSAAALRVALVDACRAGALTQPKGFLVAEPGAPPPRTSRGTAIFVSAESTEVAQETAALGSSFFTHVLVSALRGAADTNGDGRMTLAEVHSYTTGETTRLTAGWAPVVQHPSYHFDLSGHGDVVLTDLRDATALLELDSDLAGRVVVTEAGSPLTLVELDKNAGSARRLALPNGRYRVHVRGPNQVWIGELELPWGGTRRLGWDDLAPHSYQALAQKGGVVEVRRFRASLGAVLQSPVLEGMGATLVFRAGAGYSRGPWGVGVAAGWSRSLYDAADVRVLATVTRVALVASYERPLGRVDLVFRLLLEGQRWHQSLGLAGERRAFVPGAGLGATLRVPLTGGVFAAATLETVTYLVHVEGRGRLERPTLSAGLSLGRWF